MSSFFSLDISSDGVATLVLDCPDLKVNKLSTPVMEALKCQFEELASNTTIKALLIRSGKKDNYIAGADIQEIKLLNDEESGYKAARMGQAVLDSLEALPFPTVAVIHGACVGGGLELALACQFRIVTDHDRTKIGLPEVNLGIIPGFGGTQRLPRLIGLTRALPLILAGKLISGSKSLKNGIVDACVPQGYLETTLQSFVRSILCKKGRSKILKERSQSGFIPWFLNKTFIGRSIVYRQAYQSLIQKTKGHYPAPLAALTVIKKSFRKSLVKGLEIEAQFFSTLVHTTLSKNFVSLFFIQESLKKDTGVSQDIKPRSLSTLGVLGAGLMGGGIAWVFSNKKGLVRLKDVNWKGIELGLKSAQKIYRGMVKRRRITQHEADRKMHQLSGTVTYQGFDQSDVVIEAIVENMDIKKSVFSELEEHVSETTIICSNTSSLSITEMASAFKQSSRFCGMHFFSPVNRMPLVEVIPHSKTSPETIAAIVRLSKEMGKTPVVVKDCPGFLVNRLLIPYVNEAVYLLQDGMKIDSIDRVSEQFGMPMGPLALADEVGLDVGFKVAQILEDGYGSRMKVAESFENISQKKEWIGKKSGLGFYEHKFSKRRVNASVYQVIVRSDRVSISDEECLDRLFLIMVNEAAKALEERVIANPEQLDMAMIMGTGFPPFRGGLCRYADERGIQSIVDSLQSLVDTNGERFKPADLLVDMSKSNTTFYC